MDGNKNVFSPSSTFYNETKFFSVPLTESLHLSLFLSQSFGLSLTLLISLALLRLSQHIPMRLQYQEQQTFWRVRLAGQRS